MIALVREATLKSIFDVYTSHRETWLLDSYLTGGFIGYDNMSDEDLQLELSEFVDGHYTGWDDEEGQSISYECKDGEWINLIDQVAA